MDTKFLMLLHDEQGFIVSMELVLISTIAIIGLIAGLTAVRDAIVSELSDVAGAVQGLNQSYSTQGLASATATSAGSDFFDRSDLNDGFEVQSGQIENCISIYGVADEL